MAIKIFFVLFDEIIHPRQSVRIVVLQAVGDGMSGGGVHGLKVGECSGRAGKGDIGGEEGAAEGGGVSCEEGAAGH